MRRHHWRLKSAESLALRRRDEVRRACDSPATATVRRCDDASIGGVAAVASHQGGWRRETFRWPTTRCGLKGGEVQNMGALAAARSALGLFRDRSPCVSSVVSAWPQPGRGLLHAQTGPWRPQLGQGPRCCSSFNSSCAGRGLRWRPQKEPWLNLLEESLSRYPEASDKRIPPNVQAFLDALAELALDDVLEQAGVVESRA